MAPGPLLVLDSASLYYRSFYALPSTMTAPDGRPHNAVRGFLSTVARLVERHRPSGLVAAWDADWRPQWRVDLVPSYKTHRVAGASPAGGDVTEDEPEDLGPQVDAIAALLDAMGVPRWGVEGFEADDVCGSAVARASGPCVVVTGDRDLVQLVDHRTRVHLAVNGGMDKWPLLDPDAVIERFAVPASHYVDFAVLRGDPSDGLPGVPGIGAKTAAALVNAFGDVDGLLAAAAADPVTRPMTPRLAGALQAAAPDVARARRVASVVRDLDLPATPGRLPSAAGDAPDVVRIAASWGVERQVADLATVLDRQSEEE